MFPLYLPSDKQLTPEIVRKVRDDLTRRTSDTSDLKDTTDARDRSKSPCRRKYSLGNARTRSVSLETNRQTGSMPLPTVRKDSLSSESKKKDPKTFSMTLFVNETEKNKIVDLLHKAKSVISKKVEKVMGKKPKAAISNVDAIQTVLKAWMDREQEEDKEDDKLVETFIKEQEKQVKTMLLSGQRAPVCVPSLAVEEDVVCDDSDSDDDTVEDEPPDDLEVSRLINPRYLRLPDTRRSRNLSDQFSSGRSLSPVENVPCPFGNRPESELYPPKLRRPTSLYGAGACAASSRPPSRQVSVSPSVPISELETINIIPDIEVTEDYDEEEEEEAQSRYCRPDSFIIPIGGVWRPGDDLSDNEPRWSKIATDEEYLEELKREEGDRTSEPLDID